MNAIVKLTDHVEMYFRSGPDEKLNYFIENRKQISYNRIGMKKAAEDGGGEEYIGDLQQIFKNNYPFKSKETMSMMFQKALPPEKSSVADEIAGYLVENSN